MLPGADEKVNVALVAEVSAGGVLSSVVCGSGRTTHEYSAGLASRLPSWSSAATRRVCEPGCTWTWCWTRSPASRHRAQAPPSREHQNAVSGSEAESRKLAVCSTDRACGPLTIVVSGTSATVHGPLGRRAVDQAGRRRRAARGGCARRRTGRSAVYGDGQAAQAVSESSEHSKVASSTDDVKRELCAGTARQVDRRARGDRRLRLRVDQPGVRGRGPVGLAEEVHRTHPEGVLAQAPGPTAAPGWCSSTRLLRRASTRRWRCPRCW